MELAARDSDSGFCRSGDALRLLVLKHLYDWSFAECVREVRSLIYRAFCRTDCEGVPDDKTLVRLAQALGPEVWKPILRPWWRWRNSGR